MNEGIIHGPLQVGEWLTERWTLTWSRGGVGLRRGGLSRGRALRSKRLHWSFWPAWTCSGRGLHGGWHAGRRAGWRWRTLAGWRGWGTCLCGRNDTGVLHYYLLCLEACVMKILLTIWPEDSLFSCCKKWRFNIQTNTLEWASQQADTLLSAVSW